MTSVLEHNGAGARRPVTVVSVISNLEFGGAQRQLVELANYLDAERFEHHIVSLSSYVPLAQELQDHATLHVVEKRWKYDLSVVFRLERLLKTLNADVVHGYLFDAEIAARLAGRLAGVALVVGAERNTDYRLKRIQLLVYRLTRSMMDLCIANSAAGARFNERVLGHRADQYRVVPNGVNTERFRPRSQAEAQQRLGIGQGRYVVGMVASFKEQKNHGMLLRACRRLVDRGLPVSIVLAGGELHGGLGGTAEYRERMLALIEELGLERHCLFLGNRADLEEIYPAFDVSVLPSHFEGTPNVVLESMACAVPAVVTDVSDNRRLVQDGEQGFVVAAGDVEALTRRLEELARDAPLRAALGRNAREWVSREYSSARLASRTAEVYLEGLASASEAGARGRPAS